MFYTGVGSRETPPEILQLMYRLARQLAGDGWTLRSGGANGADTAFEQGTDSVQGAKEIYLPWRRFNNNGSPLYGVTDEARALAATVHPAWYRVSDAAKSLHGRNCYQVLGRDLKTPSRFLVCWTPGGEVFSSERTDKTGGTATAIVLAERNAIPRFNLARGGGLAQLKRFLREGVLPPLMEPEQQELL